MAHLWNPIANEQRGRHIARHDFKIVKAVIYIVEKIDYKILHI